MIASRFCRECFEDLLEEAVERLLLARLEEEEEEREEAADDSDLDLEDCVLKKEFINGGNCPFGDCLESLLCLLVCFSIALHVSVHPELLNFTSIGLARLAQYTELFK